MKKIFYCVLLCVGVALTACTSDSGVAKQEESTPSTRLEVLQSNVAKQGRKNSEVSIVNPSAKSKANSKHKACDVNSNMWDMMPAVISDAEKTEVLAYIATKPAGVTWPGYQKYFLQSLGGANHVYTYKDWNGASHDMPGTTAFELLTITESDGTPQVVNNFARGVINGNNNCMLMTNGFKGVYSSLNENSSSKMTHWCLFFYNNNYYLGLDYEMKKDDGKIDPDGCYDDCVLKIIPDNGTVNPDGDQKEDDPETPTPETTRGEVEFDIHQQEHKDWNEIKTSIHLRDTVNARVFIPIPQEYQAVADDFDIRLGDQYEYAKPSITINGVSYTCDVKITHTDTGIEVLINGSTMKEALRAAREAYDDGITLEVHSYVYAGNGQWTPDHATIWSWLKTIECLQSTTSGTPKSGSCATHTYGQVTSAYYPSEGIPYLKDPE